MISGESRAGASIGVLDRLRNNPELAGSLAALAILVPGGLSLNHLWSRSAATAPPAFDLNQNGLTEPNEVITEAELATVPHRAGLPSVSTIPLRLETEAGQDYEVPKEVLHIDERYPLKFAGGYRTTQGLSVNVWVTTHPGQEAVLERDFEINPEPIQYIVSQVAANIAAAPENAAKQAIIHDIESMEAGTMERVVDMVFDVSGDESCFVDYEFVASTVPDANCYNIGAASSYPGSNESTVKLVSKFKWMDAIDSQTGLPTRVYAADRLTQSTDVPFHELTHVIDSSVDRERNRNTYKEGDRSHEIIDWLTQEPRHHTPGNYDYSGASAPSPQLWASFRKLSGAGYLPLILEVR